MKKISMLLIGVLLISLLFPLFSTVEANATSTIFCPQCGKQINSDSKFCMFCGTIIPTIDGSSLQTSPTYNSVREASFNIGDIVIFGEFEQDNSYYNGKEPIEWYVIAKEDNRVKLLSKYALDRQPYNTDWVEITWEYSSLREWLNGAFLDGAFSPSEQRAILTSQVNADRNPDYRTDPGHGTMDKVFCLSINEFQNIPTKIKACAGTAFCYAEGARESQNGNCSWWLRTPGWYQKSAADVNNKGIANYDENMHKGYNVNHRGHGVRPAVWVDVSMIV